MAPEFWGRGRAATAQKRQDGTMICRRGGRSATTAANRRKSMFGAESLFGGEFACGVGKVGATECDSELATQP